MTVPFRASPAPTLGVEWELGLVDHATRDLVNAAGEVMAAVGERGGAGTASVADEMLRNTVEVVSGVHTTAGAAAEELAQGVAAVRAAAAPLGVDLVSSGTHPFARWSQAALTDGPRYAELVERTQYWGRQMLIWGVHVHVGITHVDKVLPILNSLLLTSPHLQALAGSSPYWEGTDTGYASNRALLFQQLPTAGLPFQFERWSQFERFVDDQQRTGVIDTVSEVRWDIRPSPALGTLEVRVCDALSTVAEVAAVAALVHCLVVDLDARLDDGETLPILPPWHVQENKWRAARYGLDAEIILDAAGREALVTDDLERVLDRLEPVARRLGCADELASVAEIPRRGAGCQRQRAVAAATGGDLAAVVDSLVAELAG